MVGKEPHYAGEGALRRLSLPSSAVNSGFWKIGVLGSLGSGHWPEPRIEM